jgi:hypothetical protein
MRLALVRDGVVENVIEANENFISADGALVLPAQDAGPGWTYDGERFSPPTAAPATPESVTMFQAREALRRTQAIGGGSLLDAVNAYVEAKRDDEPTLALAWEYATEVKRDGAFVMALAGLFGLDAAALDNLFRHAASIKA